MKRLKVAPRSPDWEQLRTGTWSASTAATLVVAENAKLLKRAAAEKGVDLDIEPLLSVGLTKGDHTLWSIWAEKMGSIPRRPPRKSPLWGSPHEDLVVRALEKREMMCVSRNITAVSSECPGILATFDAMALPSTDTSVEAPYGFPVEARCLDFHGRQKLWEQHNKMRPAIRAMPHLWCQIQHQIYVSQAPYGWFAASGVELDKVNGIAKAIFTITEKVPRDEKFIKAYVAAAKFFHEHYIFAFNAPPMLVQDELFARSLADMTDFDAALATDNHEKAVDLYLSALHEEQAAAKRREDLEAKLLVAAEKLRPAGGSNVTLDNRLEVTFSATTQTSWVKVAKALAHLAGLAEVPPDLIDKCKSKLKESSSLKELV